MWSMPSSRRFLHSALLFLIVVTVFRILHPGPLALSPKALLKTLAASVPSGIAIPTNLINQHIPTISNLTPAHGTPSKEQYYTYIRSRTREARRDTYLSQLFTCKGRPNPYTKHIRLSNLVFNVSQTAPNLPPDLERSFNPTIIALPHWSKNRYLLVSRVVTEGLHQRSIICEANICHSNTNSNTNTTSSSSDSKRCTTDDTSILGWAGGLRCATPPMTLNIPPTPAEKCEGAWITFPDIPGFHDPRVFWSGKGEPLIMVNSASRYGCVGLWIVDLRSVYQPLKTLLNRDPREEREELKGGGPPMSYPYLTELTRNPRSSRSAVEKNWLLYFPNDRESYVHYDIMSHNYHTSGGVRSFAKLIGNGFTTENLADPAEMACLTNEPDEKDQIGHWHQASNALKLILCTRAQARRGGCADVEDRMVHFAVVHRKFSNQWALPLRYERWFVVWDAKRPFHVLGVSRFPVLFWNETVGGFSREENWHIEDKQDSEGLTERRGNGTQRLWHNSTKANHAQQEEELAYFTYTPSIAWAWRPRSSIVKGQEKEYIHGLNVGYLDDKVVVGIGLDDTAQRFAKARAEDLLQCMRGCPLPPVQTTEETEEEEEEEL